MKIENIKVNHYDVAGVVKEINKRTEGRNVHGIFYHRDTLLSGNLEIYTTDIRTHIEKVEVPCKKVKKPSKYRGVSWDKSLCKWRARIMVNGKRISLGVYDDIEEAAEAYDLKALWYLGFLAKTNFKWYLDCDHNNTWKKHKKEWSK